jgi:hypothetical protein
LATFAKRHLENTNGVSQQSPGFPALSKRQETATDLEITHRNRKTLKLRNLRKSGVPWVNVSSILFFSGAARNSQPFVSAPLKNWILPPFDTLTKPHPVSRILV